MAVPPGRTVKIHSETLGIQNALSGSRSRPTEGPSFRMLYILEVEKPRVVLVVSVQHRSESSKDPAVVGLATLQAQIAPELQEDYLF